MDGTTGMSNMDMATALLGALWPLTTLQKVVGHGSFKVSGNGTLSRAGCSFLFSVPFKLCLASFVQYNRTVVLREIADIP